LASLGRVKIAGVHLVRVILPHLVNVLARCIDSEMQYES